MTASRRPPRRPPLRATGTGAAAVARASADWDADEADEAGPSRLRRAGRALAKAGGGAALLAALAVGLFPTQTFLQQRADTTEAEERLAVLRAQNESFQQRIERLETDDEIERLAREQYNLAYPGEEAYAVLPAPLPPLELPELWPFGPMSSAATPTP